MCSFQDAFNNLMPVGWLDPYGDMPMAKGMEASVDIDITITDEGIHATSVKTPPRAGNLRLSDVLQNIMGSCMASPCADDQGKCDDKDKTEKQGKDDDNDADSGFERKRPAGDNGEEDKRQFQKPSGDDDGDEEDDRGAGGKPSGFGKRAR